MKKTFSEREKELHDSDPDTYIHVLGLAGVVWFIIGLLAGYFFL